MSGGLGRTSRGHQTRVGTCGVSMGSGKKRQEGPWCGSRLRDGEGPGALLLFIKNGIDIIAQLLPDKRAGSGNFGGCDQRKADHLATHCRWRHRGSAKVILVRYSQPGFVSSCLIQRRDRQQTSNPASFTLGPSSPRAMDGRPLEEENPSQKITSQRRRCRVERTAELRLELRSDSCSGSRFSRRTASPSHESFLAGINRLTFLRVHLSPS